MPSIFSGLFEQKPERPQRQTSAETSILPSTQFAFRLFEALKPGDRNLAIPIAPALRWPCFAKAPRAKRESP